MDNIEEKILQFGALSPEAQQNIEAYVRDHPEWKAMLRDVKALETMCRDARLMYRADDEVLAYYVVARRTQLEPSAALRAVFRRLEERLAGDPELRARHDALQGRLEELAASLDPAAQFEKLSGYDMASLDDLSVGPSPKQTAPDEGGHQSASEARILALPRAIRWAAAAVVLVGLLYGGLYVVSEATQSDADQLALVNLSETQIEGYELTMRGAPATADTASSDALYLEALRTLRSARTSTLGLFPRYDRDRLAQAEQLLERVIEREAPRSFLQIEAHFFLGKVHLAQGDVEAARSNFQTVARQEGRRTSEAVDILTKLQEMYPAHGATSTAG